MILQKTLPNLDFPIYPFLPRKPDNLGAIVWFLARCYSKLDWNAWWDQRHTIVKEQVLRKKDTTVNWTQRIAMICISNKKSSYLMES